jgi:hypothetical protein
LNRGGSSIGRSSSWVRRNGSRRSGRGIVTAAGTERDDAAKCHSEDNAVRWDHTTETNQPPESVGVLPLEVA